MNLTIQNETIDLSLVQQLYPAAIIEYADGTVTPISLEWFENMADGNVKLIHYAICVQYKDEDLDSVTFPYHTREALEEGMRDVARQARGA